MEVPSSAVHERRNVSKSGKLASVEMRFEPSLPCAIVVLPIVSEHELEAIPAVDHESSTLSPFVVELGCASSVATGCGATAGKFVGAGPVY